MKIAKKKVEDWNKKNPVGITVTLTKDNGEKVTTITTSEAYLMPSNTPVIWLRGITGCYLLDRVKPRRDK